MANHYYTSPEILAVSVNNPYYDRLRALNDQRRFLPPGTDRDIPLHGFIFSSQHHLDIALCLLRRWGFSIIRRREYDHLGEATAYVVQLPDEYLRHHLGSVKAGQVATGLRSIANVNRDKRQKAENSTLI